MSNRTFSTFNNFPRIGRIAWKPLSRPDFADPPRRIALDDIEFAHGRIAVGAVRQLARQADAFERALAADGFAGLARRFAGTGGEHRVVADVLRDLRMLLKIGAQLVVDHRLHDAAHLGVAELGFGLPLELRIRHLHTDHRRQAFAHIGSRQRRVVLHHRLGIVVDGAGQRGLEAGQVRTAFDGVDVVRVAVDVFGGAVVVLHRHFHVDTVAFAVEIDHIGIDHRLVHVEHRHEFADAAFVVEGFGTPGRLPFFKPFVGQGDPDAGIQERQFTQPFRQNIPHIDRVGEDRPVRLEGNAGAALGGRPQFPERIDGDAAFKPDRVRFAVPVNLRDQPVGKRVYAGDADAVQTARNLVGVVVEFAAACRIVSTTSTAGLCSPSCMSTGMPRPSSSTEMELSEWMVTSIWLA